MARYWVSWWQPDDAEWSAAEGNLGEWCSGHRWRNYADRGEVDEASIVALIQAENDHHAQYIIESTHSVIEWRFRDAVADDWLPGDRFPMSDGP